MQKLEREREREREGQNCKNDVVTQQKKNIDLARTLETVKWKADTRFNQKHFEECFVRKKLYSE